MYNHVMPKMSAATSQKLLALNTTFYEDNAKSFSLTRYAIQPGVRGLLPQMLKAKAILDLGCGNGNLALSLDKANFMGSYFGVDNSQGLIDDAIATREQSVNHKTNYQFQVVDLAKTPWQIASDQHLFDIIVSYATLHHIPGLSFQQAFFYQDSNLLDSNGTFILSCWQPLNSPRLTKRVLSWQTLDIDPNELSDGDLLLDWRADEQSETHNLRYVHQFTPDKLKSLGEATGLILKETFYSDGKEGNLGLYQIWQKP